MMVGTGIPDVATDLSLPDGKQVDEVAVLGLSTVILPSLVKVILVAPE